MKVGDVVAFVLRCVFEAWIWPTLAWSSLAILLNWRSEIDQIVEGVAWIAICLGVVAIPSALASSLLALVVAQRKRRPWIRHEWTSAGALIGFATPSSAVVLLAMAEALTEREFMLSDASAFVLAACILALVGCVVGAIVASRNAHRAEALSEAATHARTETSFRRSESDARRRARLLRMAERATERKEATDR